MVEPPLSHVWVYDNKEQIILIYELYENSHVKQLNMDCIYHLRYHSSVHNLWVGDQDLLKLSWGNLKSPNYIIKR